MRLDALRRRNKLIDVGAHLLTRDGHSLTLEAVAERAGVGIATLYRNFPTREALIQRCVVAIAEQGIDELEHLVAAPPTNDREARERIEALAHMAERAGLALVVQSMAQTAEENTPEPYLPYRRRILELLHAIQEQLRKVGFIHPSVRGVDFYNGIFAIMGPQSVDLAEDFASSKAMLLELFLQGVRAGVTGPEVPGV